MPLLPGPALIGSPFNSGAAVAGQVLTADGAGGASYQYPPGYEFDYVQVTAGAPTISATTAATAQVVIQGNTVVYTAITRVKVECFGYDQGQPGILELYDGATDLGRMQVLGAASGIPGPTAVQFITLSAASHTLAIKAWKTGATNLDYDVGAGGANTVMPLWYRVTKA